MIPRGYSFIWPVQGCAAGQGMVFDLSVLNMVYNFVWVSLKSITCMIYLICWMNFFVLQVNQSNDYNVNFFYSGGGTPLYKPNRYVPPHRVGFLRFFGLNYGNVWKINRFHFKWVRKKEKNMRIPNEFEEFFCFRSNVSNDNIISA